jgi:hypothetical protein
MQTAKGPEQRERRLAGYSREEAQGSQKGHRISLPQITK